MRLQVGSVRTRSVSLFSSRVLSLKVYRISLSLSFILSSHLFLGRYALSSSSLSSNDRSMSLFSRQQQPVLYTCSNQVQSDNINNKLKQFTISHAFVSFRSPIYTYFTGKVSSTSISSSPSSSSSSSSFGKNNVNVYEFGQNLDEQFDLFEKPLKPQIFLPLKSGPYQPRALNIRKNRKNVHKDGDWHRAVHIWLTDNEGNFLMQKRSSHKDTYPSCWDVSCAGHFEAGDNSESTFRKELEEELGCSIEDFITKRETKVVYGAGGDEESERERKKVSVNDYFLFTSTSSNMGTTSKHGKFICNEYQDIYLVSVGATHNFDDYQISPGEVEAVKTLHYTKLKSILLSEGVMDEEGNKYVPRPIHYIEGLMKVMEERYSSKI